MEATLTPALDLSAATTSTTPRAVWAGRTLSGLAAAFLAFDAGIKLANIDPVVESCVELGFRADAGPTIGVIEALCLALYLVPRAAPLGATLLTGFLGGAVAIHLRLADPLFSHTLFPVYVGAMIWAGLYLRDARVRALLSPVR
jgi:hypothetical protein